jgi:spoIIIJ-associated protein
MQEIERSAASVEEALLGALTELGISEQEAVIEVVQEAKSGFLGRNPQPAVVRVRRADSANAPDLDDEAVMEQADTVADFLEGLLELMGLEADIEIGTEDGITYVDVLGVHSSDGMAVLIGRHGHTLDSLQELVRSVVRQRLGERCSVIVDVEDYRKRRRDQLNRLADSTARKVLRSGQPVALEAMSALERKIVHDAVAAVDGVSTMSEGVEPNRYVVISQD